MKTDALFYQLFQEFPWIFFELIGTKQINLEAYQFVAPEVKQRSFRLDGLFLTKEEYSTNLPLYFVEVQFYRETHFYDRLFPSIFLYFSQYKPVNPDWLAIVIFDRESKDVIVPARYRDIAQNRLKRIYLDQMTDSEDLSIGIGILKLIVEAQSSAGELAKNLIEKTKQESSNSQNQKELIELIETIVVYKFPQLNYKEIETMLNLEEIKQTKVYQDAKSEGQSSTILRLLNRKLGILSNATVEQIKNLNSSQLDSLTEDLLDFQSLDDLQQWLAQHN